MGRGLALVVSAPSGAGKTTLCHALIERTPNVEFSISYTTRPPRGQERDGVDYHFISDAEFDEMRERDAFLEWAHVHGARYGSGLQKSEEVLASGRDLLFDIDVHGGRQIAERLSSTVLVFVLPPSPAELERRLRGRGTDAEATIQKRLDAAADEIRQASFYRYLLVNDVLEETLERLRSIVVAERLLHADREALVRAFCGGP